MMRITRKHGKKLWARDTENAVASFGPVCKLLGYVHKVYFGNRNRRSGLELYFLSFRNCLWKICSYITGPIFTFSLFTWTVWSPAFWEFFAVSEKGQLILVCFTILLFTKCSKLQWKSFLAIWLGPWPTFSFRFQKRILLCEQRF